MRVFISGGAGFIGSHMTERLLKAGHEILVIDNFATGRRENLPQHKKLQLVEGSIADGELVNRHLENFQPEKVVHAAAAYMDPDNWVEDTLSNVLGAVNIVMAARNVGVERLVYFQTSLCYGLDPLEQPITLKHPLFSGSSSGGSSYAISKTAAELYIEMSGLDFISFRLANAYGPRNLSGPLPTFFHRLSNGLPCFVMDTRRDFIFVDDLVEVALKALDGVGQKGHYHVSSGSDYAIKELFDATVKALDVTLKQEVEVRPRTADDVYTILLDPSKTSRDFDWQVHTPFEKGIARAIEWYTTHGVTRTFTHLKNLGEED